MGQEQSYTHANHNPPRYKEQADEYLHRRHTPDFPPPDYDYKRYKSRRSADSFKSDNSNSSGYRSGSSTCEYSDRSGHYCPPLYKNEHYKDVNKEIYKPVKLHKEKKYNTLQLFEDREDLKSTRLKSYHSESENTKLKSSPSKKSGIRNYTPKILSDEEQRKKIENCI